MASFLNALYDSTKLGPTSLYTSLYPLTSIGNEFSVATYGTYNGQPVKGILYNSNELAPSIRLAATQVVTLSSLSDTPTILNVYDGLSGGVAGGYTFAIMNTLGQSTLFSFVSGGATTVIFQVSALDYTHVGPEHRRKLGLNG